MNNLHQRHCIGCRKCLPTISRLTINFVCCVVMCIMKEVEKGNGVSDKITINLHEHITSRGCVSRKDWPHTQETRRAKKSRLEGQ